MEKLVSGQFYYTTTVRASMGDVGACWDNAVVELFFGSLKQDWVFKIAQSTREHMKKEVAA